ncbi:RagB/SusD family nutrient uptake outer membrane protein [Sediminibacterium ginsengisoli]|uniref:Starch-binding associating with outer membrane n=1 Tax=Sediminibacterium ginsengisoli TaxID=413434 RepID=A0A1T4RI17_9BACT|nr:RagB/SusD family nutrient uptake outer membrane protein [Sediminibacterium ginsengisoli]SKA15537.1 Starch-binding associating with outer membrane [Sediminibacterium ginsengisoli]
MKRYISFIAAVIVMAGCTKNLDQTPESTASRNAVFGSEKGLELYANSFYDILPDAATIHQGDQMADYAARTQVPDFIRDGAFGPRQSSGWSWTALRNINYFLENCNNPAIPQDVRLNYIGLARLFRALFYFDKVKRFGDVPWINRTIEVSDTAMLYRGRDPRTLVMDSVLADLNFACQNIKATSDNSRSLITRYVAYGFKSRICLFEGTFRKYHTEYPQLAASANTWLTEAVTASQKVMDEGGFTLNTAGGTDKAYRQLFTSKTPVSSEIMLSVISDAALSLFNDANWWWTSATYGARVSLIRTFVNTYLNIDGTTFTSKAGYDTMQFVNEVKNRDMRLQQTIRMGDYKRINGGTPEPAPPVFSYTYTGYQPIKWTLDDTYYDGGSRNDNSICIMRLAEILLNYAEAKAELGTFTDADWNKTVGALRRRAGITNGTTTKPVAVDPYLQSKYFANISDPSLLEIRRERGIELVLEGFRFPDLIRWKAGKLMEMEWNGFYVPAIDKLMDLNGDGINDVYFYKVKPATQLAGVTYIHVAPTVSGGTNPQLLSKDTYGELTWLNTIPRKWDDKMYLYPIPEADRQVNPKLGQNPGW